MKRVPDALDDQIDHAAAGRPNSALTELVWTLNSCTASTEGVVEVENRDVVLGVDVRNASSPLRSLRCDRR